MKITAAIYFFIILSSISFAQDTVKTKKDTVKIPFRFINSESKYQYLSQVNPDTVTRKRFLWYPIKSLDDIFNYMPGYYLRTMDIGQINQLTFNQLDQFNTSVLRNGRPINDMIDGSIDLNLLSRNEIDEIEITNGYGNSNFNYLNNVNIISRQKFQYRPYTEVAFWQDRYANEYVDAYFSQNFFKGFNFNFGITKHSYDGKYANSDFDKWLGRFNFNLAPSKSLNFFLYTNYAKIQRGLNEGINPDTVDLGNKETMFNPGRAIVKNSDAYEIKERFDIDGGAIFKKGISYTKLQLYVSNSFRKYRDEENRPNPNGLYIKDNWHWINYGVKLQEILNFKLFKKWQVISRSEADYNYEIYMFNYYNSNTTISSSPGNNSFSRLYLLEDAAINYKNIYLDIYTKVNADIYSNSIKFYGKSGAKLAYNYVFDSLNTLLISGMYNTHYDYSTAGLKFTHDKNSLSLNYSYYNLYGKYKIMGINSAAALRILNFDLDLTYNYSFRNYSFPNPVFPLHSGIVELTYHNTGFKNKFEYKIGLSSRFWSDYYSVKFSGRPNIFGYNPEEAVRIPSNAALDFFIIGKLYRATFGITFENILDRLIYNTGVYPAIDRGGLFNSWSRFNITWNFFD